MSEPGAPMAVQTRNRAYLQGVVLVLLAGTIWSTAGIVVRAMDAATGWQIIFYRSAALIPTLLVLIALRNRGRVGGAFRAAGWAGVVGGLCLSLAFTGFIFALIHTTVANALFILSSAPLATAVLAWLVLREPSSIKRSGGWIATYKVFHKAGCQHWQRVLRPQRTIHGRCGVLLRPVLYVPVDAGVDSRGGVCP